MAKDEESTRMCVTVWAWVTHNDEETEDALGELQTLVTCGSYVANNRDELWITEDEKRCLERLSAAQRIIE